MESHQESVAFGRDFIPIVPPQLGPDHVVMHIYSLVHHFAILHIERAQTRGSNVTVILTGLQACMRDIPEVGTTLAMWLLQQANLPSALHAIIALLCMLNLQGKCRQVDCRFAAAAVRIMCKRERIEHCCRALSVLCCAEPPCCAALCYAALQ